MGRLFVAVSMALAAVGLAAACAERDKPRGIAYFPPAGTGGAGGGFTPGVDDCPTGSLCGDEVHELTFSGPNLYFVLDRSGSMSAPADEDDNDTRYEVVRDAAIGLVEDLGPLINVGAAVFPSPEFGGCEAGSEVMATAPGDPFEGDDPTTDAFRDATDVQPDGATPTAATLDALRAGVLALEGETLVLLLTDGAPNCNETLLCDEDGCGPNIDGTCPTAGNCCDPGYPMGGPYLCVDESATTAAVAAIAEGGVPVYVIGIPGTEYFSTLLDAMAEAGGTAQDGDTKYHKVDDLDTLGAVLAAIAAENISCEIALAEPPEELSFTNVYADCELVPQSDATGWKWNADGDGVILTGQFCEDLKAGQFAEVRVITGCPTEIPK